MSPDQDTFGKDVVDNILRIMRDTFGDQFVAYYDGDPIQIPKNNLPCIIVEKPRTQIRPSATMTDDASSSVLISLVMNKESDYNVDDSVDQTTKKLRRLVEGTNANTNNSWPEYKPGTVMYALGNHIQLGGANLELEVDIDYQPNRRPNQVTTSEALISVGTRERRIRPGPQAF